MREMTSLFALVSPAAGDVWEQWFRLCMEQEERYGFAFTHLSCKTETLEPSGIRTRSRYLKKVTDSIAKGEKIYHIEFYLLPKKFYQAAFDFRIYLGLSLGQRNSCCEITAEDGVLGEFDHLFFLRRLGEFLEISTVEVNRLPYNQVFNYNFNCILSPCGKTPEDYGLIRRIYPAQTKE